MTKQGAVAEILSIQLKHNELLKEALELLKDVCNADPAYTQSEINEMAGSILNTAYDEGILLSGEE
mgnify:CR=1 FL=1|tara:strand:+ start:515 stop:712 length:198 start_codon:yes stop_codon:yes gene_type:complete